MQGHDHPNAMPLLQYLLKLEGSNQHMPKAFLHLQISGFKIVKILNLNPNYTPLIWKMHCHKDEYRAVPRSSCNVERFLFLALFRHTFQFPKGSLAAFRNLPPLFETARNDSSRHLSRRQTIVKTETSVLPTGCQTVGYTKYPMETSPTNKTVFPHTPHTMNV